MLISCIAIDFFRVDLAGLMLSVTITISFEGVLQQSITFPPIDQAIIEFHAFEAEVRANVSKRSLTIWEIIQGYDELFKETKGQDNIVALMSRILSRHCNQRSGACWDFYSSKPPLYVCGPIGDKAIRVGEINFAELLNVSEMTKIDWSTLTARVDDQGMVRLKFDDLVLHVGCGRNPECGHKSGRLVDGRRTLISI